MNQRMGFFERNGATTTEGSAEDGVGIFSATLICSIESSSLEFPMPLVLKLQPSHLTSSDFEHYWHSEWPQHAEDSGAEDGVTEEEPDDGKTKVCVRFEDPPHIIAYCRLHPDMLLCEARNVLLDDATIRCHLPNDWVYVKKGAPVGKKAEPKWHVSDTVPNIIIRNKSKEPIDLAALASKQPAATAAAAGRREVAIAEHSFRVACTGPASETQVVQRLGVANLRLAGRLETGLTVVQLLFATHTEHDFFLLRLTVDAQLPEHYRCLARASDAHLFAELEQCVRVALGDAASFATFHHISGGGDPFYGNFIGVSLEDAVNHNTDELHTTVNHFRLSAVLALISVVAAVAVAATVVTTRPTHLSAANALVGSDDTVVKTGKHVESGSIMVLGTTSFNSLLTLEKVAFIYHKPGDADVSQIGFAVTMVDRAHGITHVYGPDRLVRAS